MKIIYDKWEIVYYVAPNLNLFKCKVISYKDGYNWGYYSLSNTEEDGSQYLNWCYYYQIFDNEKDALFYQSIQINNEIEMYKKSVLDLEERLEENKRLLNK
jgi:hypothetical protein